MIFRVFCVSVILFTSVSIEAQQIFSTDTAQFYSEIKNYIFKSNKTKAETALTMFLAHAKNNQFKSQQIDGIIQTCNTMREQKMVVSPHFTIYLKALNAAAEKELTNEAIFDDWMKVSEKTAQNSGKSHQYFKNFMAFSEAYFLEQLIYKSDNKYWLYSTTAHSFLFEDSLATVFFNEGILKGYSDYDSLTIESSNGKYYPSIYLWKSNKGKISWQKAGFPADTVFATIPKYEVNIKDGTYDLSDATFTYLNFLNQNLQGELQGKLLIKKSNETFPKFTAYNKIELSNLGKNIIYKGGFAMQGSNIIGLGDSLQKAELHFYAPQKQIHIKTTAERYDISNMENITAQQVALSIYSNQGDSIYHPDLTLQYNIPKRELKLLRSNLKGINIPYNDSYHDLDFKVDGINWLIDSTYLSLSMITSEGNTDPAFFQSQAYFNKKEIQKYRSFTDINPVYELKAYCDNNNTRIMPAAEFADALGKQFTAKSINNLLFNLMEDGFIYYDELKEQILIRDKVILHGLANLNKTDYDVIKIQSEAANENAILDINNYNLTISGLTAVRLSKAKDVLILPRSNTLQIGQNRTFNFDGTVLGGRVDFVGTGFTMNYDNFSITMPQMQEVLINYPSFQMSASGKPELEPVLTKIEDLSGTLYIDVPSNKSGLMGNRDYPKFKSDGTARTYYDEGPFKNLYRRDSFYFELKPFQLDSLWILSHELLALDGKLVSSEIFEDMDQTLTIQLDRSLGFEIQAPEAGYPMYNGAGTFKGKLKLNSKGLNGSGSFRALTAELNSNAITFYPDSILATCDTFFLEKKTSPHQPLTKSNGPVDVNWKAKKDTLTIKNKYKPFILYDNQATFEGDLLLSSTGLYGEGLLNWESGTLSAKRLKFEANKTSATVADLTIQALDTSSVAFATKNVQSSIDFENQLGQFSTPGNIEIDLPFNQYKTTLRAFDWKMREGLIEIYTPTNTSENYYFVSTDKNKTDLQFVGKSALYNLNNYILQVDGVPYVEVSGAKMIPHENKLTINPGGVFDTLYNATLLMDTVNNTYPIYDATLFIESAEQLQGSGKCDYVSSKIGTQTVVFDSIETMLNTEKKPTSKRQIVATGNIAETDSFKLDQLFDYKGKISLYNDEPLLEFNGFSKINLKNDSLATNWFHFKDFIDPENVQIEMSGDLKGENEDTLLVGVNFNYASNHLYTVFINKPINSSDHTLVKANGFINYDRPNNIFSIGDKAKINADSYRGRIFNFNDNNGFITTEGSIEMGNYPLMSIDVAGSIENDLLRRTFKFDDLVAGFDFLFDEDLLKLIGNTIQEANEGATEIDFTAESFKKGIAELVKPKKVEETIESIDRLGYYSKAKDVNYALLITDLHLQFNEVSRTLISTQPFGLAYVGDKYINRMVNGYIEFGNRSKGDYFTIYIKADQAEEDTDNDETEPTWFYFAYSGSELNALSSDGDFNSKLTEIKLPKRELKVKKNTYRYQQGNFIKKDNFVARMKGQAGY